MSFLPTDQHDQHDWYELPVNDSILQGAGPTPGVQFATNTTGATGCNEQWRFNSRTDTAMHTNPQTHATRSSNRNIFITIHRTLQTIELAPHVSNVENKVT